MLYVTAPIILVAALLSLFTANSAPAITAVLMVTAAIMSAMCGYVFALRRVNTALDSYLSEDSR